MVSHNKQLSTPSSVDSIEAFREKVSFVKDDKVMYRDIEASVKFLQEVELDLPEDLMMYRDYSPADMR